MACILTTLQPLQRSCCCWYCDKYKHTPRSSGHAPVSERARGCADAARAARLGLICVPYQPHVCHTACDERLLLLFAVQAAVHQLVSKVCRTVVSDGTVFEPEACARPCSISRPAGGSSSTAAGHEVHAGNAQHFMVCCVQITAQISIKITSNDVSTA